MEAALCDQAYLSFTQLRHRFANPSVDKIVDRSFAGAFSP